MLNVKCPEWLAKVKEYAAKVGLSDQLEKQLDHLATYGGGEGRLDYCRCDLYQDFAPWSFQFTMYRTEEGKEPSYWFNGGLIYQGPACPADGSFPSLTMSLNPKKHGWFVHT